MIKRICVATGTRAEYYLLKPLLEYLHDDDQVELQILVTGMHLSPEFGMTVNEIKKDGFNINEQVEILLSSDSQVGTLKAMGLGLISFAEALNRLKPDMIVVLGDRFEILSVAQSALVLNIPLAHIHGGELTFGAFDDAMRHAITKMAHLHFVATRAYAKRVIQMGEEPKYVHHVGACVNDTIAKTQWLDKATCERDLDLNLDNAYLITYHPETKDLNGALDELNAMLACLEHYPAVSLIFTGANADPMGRRINERLQAYCSNRDNAKFFQNLGQLRYLSVMRQARLVLGNSSSGILEAPLIGRASINIGNRQNGRLQPQSVIQTSIENLNAAIEQALSDDYQQKIGTMPNPYWGENIAQSICKTLKTFEPYQKSFYDIQEKSDAKDHHYS